MDLETAILHHRNQARLWRERKLGAMRTEEWDATREEELAHARKMDAIADALEAKRVAS